MFTLTNIAVLSGLVFNTMLSGNAVFNDALTQEDGKNEIVGSADFWKENSISGNLAVQSDDSIKTEKIAKIEKNNKYEVAKEGVVPVSAYSSTIDQTDDSPFIMASGNHVYDGAIAANFLPLGTKVKFPETYGDKIFTVEDRMNKRYSYQMDIWMETRQEAKNFGVRKLKYEIIKDARNQILAEAK